jgi:hypothetical protein
VLVEEGEDGRGRGDNATVRVILACALFARGLNPLALVADMRA